LSKLSQLKQDAYQAGKKRDWETAVSIYEQILEVDKSNPSLVNELGDLCLKTGDVRSAVKHFLSAASKYRTNGLLNNAVAIYKKVLRHDSSNLNAHWYLSETRASQGLLVEGEGHGVQFLENSNDVSGDIKEIFLKRCVLLFEMYSASTPIMERLLQIFRMWDMPLEAARVTCILACQIWDAGKEDSARESMQNVVAQTPDVVKYPEHAQWEERSNPSTGGLGSGYSDVNSLDLGAATTTNLAVEKNESAAAEIVEPMEPVAEPESWAGGPVESRPALEIEIPETSAKTDNNSVDLEYDIDQDDDGCFSLDSESPVSFDELIAKATEEVVATTDAEPSEFLDPFDVSKTNEPQFDQPKSESDEPVDLLAQILADDSNSFEPQETNQVATITEEIESKVGAGGEGDEGSLYEMGLVYLEMDMHDQACESFEKAACNPEYAVRAHEMWGITLLRSGKLDEAVITLTAGLDLPEEGTRQQLGLLYHLGRAQEQAQRYDEAQDCYQQIHALDRSFLDVGKRIAELSKI